MDKLLIFNIDDIMYEVSNDTNLKEGDLVIDKQDGTYGYIDMVIGDYVAIRHDFVAELRVHKSRCIKLVQSVINNSLN